jgi:hypothetical protein
LPQALVVLSGRARTLPWSSRPSPLAKTEQGGPRSRCFILAAPFLLVSLAPAAPDGATPGQCLELEQEVEMESLVRLCRFHFSAYRDFLLHRGEYGSYPEYLARRAANTTPGGGEVQ